MFWRSTRFAISLCSDDSALSAVVVMILHFFFAASNATAEPREDEEDSEHAHEPETVPDALAIGFLDLSESFVTALVARNLDWFHHRCGNA